MAREAKNSLDWKLSGLSWYILYPMNRKEVEVYDLETIWQCWVTGHWHCINLKCSKPLPPNSYLNTSIPHFFISRYAQLVHRLKDSHFASWFICSSYLCAHVPPQETLLKGQPLGRTQGSSLSGQREASPKPKERGHPTQNMRNCCPLGISSPGLCLEHPAESKRPLQAALVHLSCASSHSLQLVILPWE